MRIFFKELELESNSQFHLFCETISIFFLEPELEVLNKSKEPPNTSLFLFTITAQHWSLLELGEVV
jgi:hypothetical protein